MNSQRADITSSFYHAQEESPSEGYDAALKKNLLAQCPLTCASVLRNAAVIPHGFCAKEVRSKDHFYDMEDVDCVVDYLQRTTPQRLVTWKRGNSQRADIDF